MIVLSVDQAKTTGWAIFDNEELIDYGCIRSKFNNYCDVSFHVCTHINALIDKYNPDIVLFEDVANQSNSLTHKNLSMLLKGQYLVNMEIKNFQQKNWCQSMNIKVVLCM